MRITFPSYERGRYYWDTPSSPLSRESKLNLAVLQAFYPEKPSSTYVSVML